MPGREVERDRPALDRRVGLCSICENARPITSAHGSIFWLCELSKTDGRFRKYPALPVAQCDGFHAVAPTER